MDTLKELQESVVVSATPEQVFGLVSDVRRVGEWSPECVGVLARRGPLREGDRFIGLNRRGLHVWPTTCRVARLEPGAVFGFRVTALGVPIARWTYRITSEADGTRLTEEWADLRTGSTGGLAKFLGTLFAGTPPEKRIEVNRAGMRTTLQALKRIAESPADRAPAAER
ncbi:SRPBCC family protein [Kitasatospora sp. NPDC059571]|uniref:SRPBCC family protein n=1 Tax=Kitasatospora sp. NPDC059571 TaxID=3346871 RepID=UPI0036B893C2